MKWVIPLGTVGVPSSNGDCLSSSCGGSPVGTHWNKSAEGTMPSSLPVHRSHLTSLSPHL